VSLRNDTLWQNLLLLWEDIFCIVLHSYRCCCNGCQERRDVFDGITYACA